MREFAAIAAAILFALILWQCGMKTTDAAVARPQPDYAITTDPYLPVHNLEPVY
jgi:hypothetical protein